MLIPEFGLRLGLSLKAGTAPTGPQAPGRRVSETRLSFNDRSGDRLRAWLAIDRETFCDEAQVAILGIAFCFPGLDGKGGDLPARSRRR